MYDTYIFLGIILLLALIIIVVVPIGMMMLVFRPGGRPADSSHHMNTDVASMNMLFQTMRDFLSEQKAVARDFNKDMDKKMTMVRNMMEEVRREPEKLRKAGAELAAVLAEVRQNLAEVQRGVEEVRADAPPTSVPEETTPRAGDVAIPRPPSEDELAQRIAPLLDEPEDLPDSSELIESWTGLEVTTGEVAVEDEEEEEVFEPESPEDAQAARDAFRSLLNMEDGPEPDPEASNGGNGANGLSPLQLQIYDYVDAGMKLSDIAQELGVTKGDVRMILSMREEHAD